MMRFRAVVALLAGVAALGHPVAAQKDPAAADLLRAAADYVATYAARVSGVSLEEDYTLLDVSGGRVVNNRRIASDVVLLNLDGKVVALRDAFSVDSNPLRERTPRITTLLAKPSQAAWDKAQAAVAEAARYFEDDLILRLNDPTLALQFIAPDNQSKMTYKIDGRKRLTGVETVGLRFQEVKRREGDYIIATRGKAAGSGRLWVDPASGRIHRTELAMQSASEFVRVAVDFTRDAALDLWLPGSMVDSYEITEVTGPGMSSAGASSNVARRSFDCRASYTNARLTPIDLTVAVPK
jgi:hypothetical protein